MSDPNYGFEGPMAVTGEIKIRHKKNNRIFFGHFQKIYGRSVA